MLAARGLLVTHDTNRQDEPMIKSRLALAATGSLAALPALAHPGHVEEVAGHSHWLSWGAGAAAIAILAGALVIGYRTVSRRNR